MKIQLVITKSRHCTGVEQELQALELPYTVLYAEEHPELVERFDIRHSPTLIIDETQAIPVDEQNASQVETLLHQLKDRAHS